jgi:hypothetical protein
VSSNPRQSPPRQPYGLLIDPLSPDHLLLTCAYLGKVFRMSLTDGVVTVVAGTQKGRHLTEGPATSVRLAFPTTLVEAPREWYRGGDALVCLMAESQGNRLCLIRVP